MRMNVLQSQTAAGPLMIRQSERTTLVPVRDVRLNDIVIIDQEKVVVCRLARDSEPMRGSRSPISLCHHERPTTPGAERIMDGLPLNSAGDVVMLLVI